MFSTPEKVTPRYFKNITTLHLQKTPRTVEDGLENISSDKESSFIESAKQAGVGIAAAWDAVPPNYKEERRKKGLFIRLTFPAYEPDKIKWGISKLKETAERLA